MGQKGQMKIIAGIIVLLLVIGIVLWTQLFGKPKEDQPKKEATTKENQAAKKETGFFDKLFSGTPTETKKSSGSGTGFFDKLFGGANSGEKATSPTGGGNQGGFFDKLFGGSGGQTGSGSQGVSSPTSTPIISSGLPTGDLPAETRKVNLSLKTDKIATCKYNSGSAGLSYDGMQNVFSQTNAISHSTEVTGLNEGTAYKYYIKCANQSGVKNTGDYVISFRILAPKDTTPPIVRNPSHQGDVLPAGATSVVISVSTDEQANCRHALTQGILYRSMGKGFTHYDQTKRFHVATITGLQNSKAYEFFARCQDLSGNANTGDVMISFTTR